MSSPSELLLIDAGQQPMHLLTARLKRLGYRALPVKTPDEAREALIDPRHRVGAVVIPPDLAATNLRGALDSLRGLGRIDDLTFLVAGVRPGPEGCETLREAGVRFGLWEPVDAHTLRFLVNYSLACPEEIQRERSGLRVPADWSVQVRTAQRSKGARVYSISSTGAYLATDRPMLRKSLVHLSLPLPSGAIQTAARVVMTNVPGNLQRANLPIGMGVVFTGTTVDDEALLASYAEERFRTLEL